MDASLPVQSPSTPIETMLVFLKLWFHRGAHQRFFSLRPELLFG